MDLAYIIVSYKTIYAIYVHFTIHNTNCNPPKNNYIVKNSIFLFLWGYKMQMKASFMVLEFCYLALERFWKFV